MIRLHNAQIGKVSTMADGSIKIELHTQELSSEEMTKLFQLKKGETLGEVEFPEDRSDPKSHSQRLRAVLYRLWEQSGVDKDKIGHESFYRDKMENLIQHIKDKLK